jgi:hypothetical protein
MLNDDVAVVQKLKEELLEMKVRYKDAIENKKKYEDCLARASDHDEYLVTFKRMIDYFLDKEGF